MRRKRRKAIRQVAWSKRCSPFAITVNIIIDNTKDYITMATAIKAIPTLKGKEAREFLRHAEEAERNYKGTNNGDDHSFCQMAHAILSKAGML